MGRVFTFQEIVDDRVPSLETQQRIAAKIPERLKQCPGIIGAVGLGSLQRGDGTRRSDHDWVVLYKDSMKYDARLYLQDLCTLGATQHAVDIDFIQCTDAIARTRFHHLGPVFQDHFVPYWYAHGPEWTNPVDILAASVEPREEIEGYLRVKLYKLNLLFSKSGTYRVDSERRMEYLRKLLEAPVHVARKILLCQLGTLADDSKEEVVELFTEMVGPALGSRLRKYHELDRTYTEQLDAQVQQPNEKEYRWFLRDIEAQALEIVDLFERSAQFLHEC